jgi:hypothetical protein
MRRRPRLQRLALFPPLAESRTTVGCPRGRGRGCPKRVLTPRHRKPLSGGSGQSSPPEVPPRRSLVGSPRGLCGPRGAGPRMGTRGVLDHRSQGRSSHVAKGVRLQGREHLRTRCRPARSLGWSTGGLRFKLELFLGTRRVGHAGRRGHEPAAQRVAKDARLRME